jgi:TolB-like protein/DNA-binding winged helix-turn-helix (wHTH) protein/Tfp pilus assembly protein PilF
LESEPARFHRTIKFGRDFELDPEFYELRRSGRVLKLERIPMSILLLLVRQRDRIVGRQEIVDNVWGKGVSLDADNSINGAIRKIRQALKDDSDQPRFIQTITGRGYRFIALVETQETKTEQPDSAEIAAGNGDSAAQTLGNEALAAHSAVESENSASHAQPAMVGTTARSHSLGKWIIVAAALLAATLAGVIWFRRAERNEVAKGSIRLAVLPFQNLTGDVAQEYFSDGFTEEMITQLGSLDPQMLAVIARTSVMHYKDTRTPLPQIAHDLDVQYVLEGSVRRDANNVRIAAQLIQVRDQTHLWAHEYDQSANDLLAIQSEIAKQIAREIQLTLHGRRPVIPPIHSALSPQEYAAYDLYLRGRYLWSKRTPEGLQEAAESFKQAIAKDPSYAHAYAGLADTYAMMSGYGYVPATVYMPQARAAALKALQIDDSLAEAHTSLALIAENYDWDWQTAEKEFRRAIQLNSNYATAHQWFAECLAYEGRLDEALAESERARQLDPVSLIIAADNGAIYYFSRQYDRAIAEFGSVLQVDPSLARAHLIIAAYIQQGRYSDAFADLDQWRRVNDGPWISALQAYIYGRSGDQAKAQQALADLNAANRKWRLDPTTLLNVVYAGLGDKEKWLAFLQEACSQRNNLATGFKVDPMYDPLRGDPRFEQLLRTAGFKDGSSQ